VTGGGGCALGATPAARDGLGAGGIAAFGLAVLGLLGLRLGAVGRRREGRA
jgi:hypothetical protein